MFQVSFIFFKLANVHSLNQTVVVYNSTYVNKDFTSGLTATTTITTATIMRMRMIIIIIIIIIIMMMVIAIIIINKPPLT